MKISVGIAIRVLIFNVDSFVKRIKTIVNYYI